MPRRCLDCDHIYAAMRTCPKCGSKHQLYLPPAETHGPDPIIINAWLALAHTLILTGVTHGRAGSTLGTSCFALGVCAILVLVGTERAQKGLTFCWAGMIFVYLFYLALTDQTAVAGIGLVVSVLGLLHALPWNLPWEAATVTIGFALNFTLVIGIVLSAIGLEPPGWWHGAHPPLLQFSKVAANQLTRPTSLPPPASARP